MPEMSNPFATSEGILDARSLAAQMPGDSPAMLVLGKNLPWSRGSDGFPQVLYTVITRASTLREKRTKLENGALLYASA